MPLAGSGVLGRGDYAPAEGAQWTAAAYRRDALKVVGGRRRGGRPLERVGLPWVGRWAPAAAQADSNIDQDEQDCGRDHKGPDGRDQVPGSPVAPVGVPGGDPPRHPLEAEKVHGHERDVETEQLDPE